MIDVLWKERCARICWKSCSAWGWSRFDEGVSELERLCSRQPQRLSID